MGILLEIIDWTDQQENEMVRRVPPEGAADIKFGAQLVVRESQAAVFFRDGKAYDVLGPGRHTLSTLNLPLLTRALALPYGFRSPFQAEVYFVSTKIFTNLKWGTRDPVAFKDSELGLIRLRGFGTYTFRVVQPLLFINTLVGVRGHYLTDHVEGFLRDVVVSRLNDLLGEILDTILNLPKHYDELAAAAHARIAEDFARYGVGLLDFYINSITPPEDVQQMIDAKAGMTAVGDLNEFLKFKAAQALERAADGAGGDLGPSTTGEGMGLGLGAGLGLMLPGILKESMGETKSRAPQQACPNCSAAIPAAARFCNNCGHQVVTGMKCPECASDLPADANFCSSCGARVREAKEKPCPGCGFKNLPEARFCNNCGEKLP